MGAMLASFTADIDFDVSDTAANLAAQVASGVAQGYGSDRLDEAIAYLLRVVRLLQQHEAADIQDLINYSGGDIDITDNAVNLISAVTCAECKAGVDIVTASDTSVTAKIGGDLAGFTADVEFNVKIQPMR